MPLIPSVTYRPSFPFTSGHVQTIYPTIIRRVPDQAWQRERIATPDGDFLDIDWVRNGFRRAAILCHGLEGDARRSYMRGMTRALSRRAWDVVPWNYRGCSGEANRKIHAYHSGFTQDLETVVRHVLDADYASVALVGFSLGGNLVLKYLGDKGDDIDPRVRRAFAASVPADLETSADRMARWDNAAYMQYFLRKLATKVRRKATMFPGEVDPSGLLRMRTFREFDGKYTAPWGGFDSAHHYWEECSCKPVLQQIRIPTLLLQAADDPLLPPACYPVHEAEANPDLHLEISRHGGHVGFFARGGEFYGETRAAEFLNQ